MNYAKILFSTVFLVLLASTAESTVLGSEELIVNASVYDGQIVEYSGEVVGVPMKRGDMAWVNIHDGVNAIGVLCDSNLLEGITYYGNYHHTGDTVQVTGVFHKADEECGGDLDIRCTQLTVLEQGRITEHPLSIPQIGFSSLAILFLLLLVRHEMGVKKK